MAHKLKILNPNLINYLKRRSYFTSELYRTIIMSPTTKEELEELDKFILNHNISFTIVDDNGMSPQNMKYEYSLNYKIPNSDIATFKKKLTKLFLDINKTIDKTFLIHDYDLSIVDSMLIGIEVKLSSLVDVSSSKYYFDYVVMPKISKFLKNLNINKKRKNVS